MSLLAFLNRTADLTPENVEREGDGNIAITAQPQGATAVCPTCETPSHRIHSHSVRAIADLPIPCARIDALSDRRLQHHLRELKAFAEDHKHNPGLSGWARCCKKLVTKSM